MAIGFAAGLQIIFLALKIFAVITWSWVWVLAPLWLSLLLYAIGVLLVALGVRVGPEDYEP
jgi:hypothetical protein